MKLSDPRLDNKPQENDGSLPIMIYDFRELPYTSENIWHAQMAGWPRILTYDGKAMLEGGALESKSQRKKRMSGKRRENLEDVDAGEMGRFRLPTSQSEWRDEYPFASTVENEGSTWVGQVDAGEQRRQAGLISGFYRKHKAFDRARNGDTPFWFEVKVINMPQDRRK